MRIATRSTIFMEDRVLRYNRCSELIAVVSIAAIGLTACGSETPETIQYPQERSAAMRPQNAVPPPPPQPSSETQRESERIGASDGTLAAMVESAIAAEPELNTLGIEVTAADGTIYLRGKARTREARRLATEIASKVDGVERVQNELFVVAGSQPEERRVGDIASANR
jgi:hypothetical protein